MSAETKRAGPAARPPFTGDTVAGVAFWRGVRVKVSP